MQESIHEAATILLVRENGGLEVYLTKRPSTMRFLPDHHVFPGGQMDESDHDPRLLQLCAPLPPDANPEGIALAYWVTALRETFEEAGILLARNAQGASVPQEPFAEWRERLLAGECSFYDVVAAANAELATDRMRYYGHRLTPRAVSRKRFSTRYFLSVLPEGVEPVPHAGEVVEDLWIAPGDALERWQAGRMLMVPPTVDSLRVLSRFPHAQAAMLSREGVGKPTAEELA